MNPAIKERTSPVRPAGAGKGAWLATLEQGANLLQDIDPLKGFDVYVVGFHCARDDPGMQMEAHHYCRVVNADFLQCVLFDGNTRRSIARASATSRSSTIARPRWVSTSSASARSASRSYRSPIRSAG
jgi:hypothetical protein